jgi:competence protein ComEA
VTPELLQVYVSGAVTTAQVITLPQGSLVRDALEAIGGPAPHADLNAINLAEPVRDYQHVLVPERAHESAVGAKTVPAAETSSTRVNLNTADAAELETLPHIGPSRAEDILAYRETNGPFTSVEEIKNVKGIGDATFADLAPLITVDP